jgi:hypothetical protein
MTMGHEKMLTGHEKGSFLGCAGDWSRCRSVGIKSLTVCCSRFAGWLVCLCAPRTSLSPYIKARTSHSVFCFFSLLFSSLLFFTPSSFILLLHLHSLLFSRPPLSLSSPHSPPPLLSLTQILFPRKSSHSRSHKHILIMFSSGAISRTWKVSIQIHALKNTKHVAMSS